MEAMLSKNHKVGWIEILNPQEVRVLTGSRATLDQYLMQQQNKSAAKLDFKSTSSMPLSSSELTGTALLTPLHKCGICLKVLVTNYSRLCSSISVRSKNSISWQIEVALIRKLRFHSFEGEVWSDTSKGFWNELSWVGGWWQKGKHLMLWKNEPDESGTGDEVRVVVGEKGEDFSRVWARFILRALITICQWYQMEPQWTKLN